MSGSRLQRPDELEAMKRGISLILLGPVEMKLGLQRRYGVLDPLMSDG